jgi:hypothetical protein
VRTWSAAAGTEGRRSAGRSSRADRSPLGEALRRRLETIRLGEVRPGPLPAGRGSLGRYQMIMVCGKLVTLALAHTLAGCSGTTIIDEGGAGGAGGSGVNSTSATTTAPADASATSTTSGSAGGASTLCGVACDSLTKCGGGAPGCKEACEHRAEAPCGELHQAWLSCSIGLTHSMCNWGPITFCWEHLRDYHDCTGELGTCGGFGSDSCSCSLAENPDVELTQTCASGSCHCLVNGQTWGLCEEAAFGCEIPYSCCAGPFFTGGP